MNPGRSVRSMALKAEAEAEDPEGPDKAEAPKSVKSLAAEAAARWQLDRRFVGIALPVRRAPVESTPI